MSTTTIRLPDELKVRIAAAAKRAGTTPHNFILQAIADKAEAAEHRADFHAEADRRYAEFLKTGESIPWDDMRRYLEDRLAGKSARRSPARKLDRRG